MWQYSTTDGHLDRNVCTPDTFRALSGTATPATIPVQKGPLMALSDAEQQELFDKTRRNNEILEQLASDYLTRGQGVRQVIAVIDHRTEDLVTGRRPGPDEH